MKSIFTFLWGSLLTCSAAAQTTLSDACVVRFKMDARTSQTCNGGSAPSHNGTSITLLGKRIADGFFWDREPISVGSGRDNLYGKNGSLTPPTGSVFNDHPGNWVYFTASGFTSVGRKEVSKELINIYLRIRVFGNERNPDSLRVEFAKNSTFRANELFNSAKKTIRCNNACIATDREKPYISCPYETVQFPLVANQTTIQSQEIMDYAHITASDDCALNDIRTYPQKLEITHGQIVNYHTVAYDSAGNQSICRFKAQLLSPTNDTCTVSFSMEERNTITCDGTHSASYGDGSIHLLGKRIADGIMIISRKARTILGPTTVLFGKNGSKTPPTGSHFITCSGNWTYFTVSGRSTLGRSNEKIEYPNTHLRVKNFGNESNPDSLRIEFSKHAEFPGGRFFNTGSKWVNCDKCRIMDKTPPAIQRCPTQIVKYPVSDPLAIFGNSVATLAKIKVSDNCQLEDVNTYPYRVSDAKKGQIIDFHTVAYDEAGNKSICRFKAQAVVAPCTELSRPLVHYVLDVEVLAAAGQTCQSVTLQAPAVYNESSFYPVKLTSNYPSGHCFPIGVTRVLHTAKDSCGKIDTAGFFVTVRKSNVPDSVLRLSADNQQVTLDIKTLSPNPTDGALTMKLKSLVEKEVTFDFYNLIGSKVYSQTQSVQKGENELFFDVAKLPTGIYFIQTSELGEQNATTKFVKN